MSTATRLRATVLALVLALATLVALLTVVVTGPGALASPAAQPGPAAGNRPPPAGGARPTEEPGPTEQPTEEPTEEPTPTEPPPDTEPPPPPDLGEPVVEPGGEVTLAFAAEDRSLVVAVEVTETGEEPVDQQRANGQPQELTWTAESGERTYSVTATDREGNESDPATVVIEIDADPPVVRRFEVTSGDAKDPLSSVLLVTEPAVTYAVTVDDEVVASGTTPKTGREVIEETLDLADGRYPVKIDLADETGNTTEDTQVLVVDVGDLFLRARLTSEPIDPQQEIQVRATPGTTGEIRVEGQRPTEFEVDDDGTAEVLLTLPDGEYDGAVVTVGDTTGRQGRAEIGEFMVDTTAPGLELAEVEGIAAQGRVAFQVVAEPGSEVDWRVLDADGRVVTLGTFLASEAPEVIERDVEEGAVTVEVSTSDVFGRTAEQSLDLTIASDPLSPRTLALAALVALIVLLALAVLARRLWRRRQERRAEEEIVRGPRSSPADDLAAYQEAEAAWVAQHQALSRLAQVARGHVPDDVSLPAGFEPRPGEVPWWSTPARRLDVVADQAAPVEGAAGEVVVTDQRVSFVGPTSRDWWLTNTARVRHLDHERTLLIGREDAVGGSAAAGVAYDAQITRQYVDLALARSQGAAYDGIVDRGLRDHEMRRPTPPA